MQLPRLNSSEGVLVRITFCENSRSAMFCHDNPLGGGRIPGAIWLRTGGVHSHARIPVLKKNKRPTSVVESYKTTYGHKAVVLMSVVEGRAENICST